MDWTKKLLEYAPDIAAAVFSGGATLPALAIKAIKDATGEDVSTESDIKRVVENITPEQELKLVSANNTFKVDMQRLTNELTYAELADTQQARESHKLSSMPAIICSALTIIITLTGYMIFTLTIPDSNMEIAYLLFGALITKWGDSIAYWVGTTRSSAQKTIQSSLDKAGRS
jgi:hypothetical protein